MTPSSGSRVELKSDYLEGVQGVSNRSNVFLIVFRFAAFACGQNDRSRSRKAMTKLWEVSERETGVAFDVPRAT